MNEFLFELYFSQGFLCKQNEKQNGIQSMKFQELSQYDKLKVKEFLSLTNMTRDQLDGIPLDLLLNCISTQLVTSSLLTNKILTGSFCAFLTAKKDEHNEHEYTSLTEFIQTLTSDNPLKNRILDLIGEDCPICLDVPANLFFSCGHATCATCIDMLVPKNCPMCRAPITEIMDQTKSAEIVEQKDDSDNSDSSDDIKVYKKFTIITDINEFVTDRINKIYSMEGGSLSEQQLKEITYLIRTPYLNNILDFAPIRSEEARCYTAALMFNSVDFLTNTKLMNFVTKTITTPNRLIRMLAALVPNKTAIEKNDEITPIVLSKPDIKAAVLLKMKSRGQRRYILSLINRFADDISTSDDFIRHEPIWKYLFAYLHVGEELHAKRFPLAYKFAFVLRNYGKANKLNRSDEHIQPVQKPKFVKKNGKKIIVTNKTFMKVSTNAPYVIRDENALRQIRKPETIIGLINKMLKTRNETIFEHLLQNQGLAFRFMHQICETFASTDSENLTPFLFEVMNKMNTQQLIDIHHVFKKSDTELTDIEKHPNIFITSKGTMHWDNLEREKIRFYSEISEQVANIAFTIAVNKQDSQKNDQIKDTDILIIDNKNNQLTSKRVNRGKISEAVEWMGNNPPANRGDVIKIPPEICESESTQLVVFIHWKQNDNTNVDLDLSMVGFDKNYDNQNNDDNWTCSYYNLEGFTNSVFHSGDVRSAPAQQGGGSEFIRLNVKNFRETNPTISHLLTCVQSYSKVEFDKLKDVFIGIGYISGMNKPIPVGEPVSTNIKFSDSGETTFFSNKNETVFHIISACKLSGSSMNNMCANVMFGDDNKTSIRFINLNLTKPLKIKSNHNRRYNANYGNTASHYMETFKMALRMFDIWCKSCNSPPSIMDNILISAAGYKQVQYIDDTCDNYYRYRQTESIDEFVKRIGTNDTDKNLMTEQNEIIKITISDL